MQDKSKTKAQLLIELEELRQGSTEIESIYDSAPIGLALFDLELRYVRINKWLAKLNGIPVEEHIGKSVWEILPEIAPLVEDVARKVLDSGESVLFEIRGETPANPGTQRDFIEHWLPLKDQDGNTTHINVLVQEITERKRAEEALRESEERLRAAISGSQGGEWQIPADEMQEHGFGDAAHLSPQCKSFIGFADDEFPNSVLEWRKRIHPDDVQAITETARAHFDNGSLFYNAEYRIRHKDGSWRHLLTTGRLQRNSSGRPLRWIGIDWDITERKRAEERLRESEERFRRVANAGRIGFFEWNATRDTSYWSSQHYDIFGIEPGNPVTFEQWLKYVHPEDCQRITESSRELLQEASAGNPGHMRKDEYRIIHVNRGLRWLEADVTAEIVKGEIIVQGVIRDITERKQAEAALRESEERFRLVSENMAEGMVLFDTEGSLIYQNAAALSIHGFAPDEQVRVAHADLPVVWNAWDETGRPVPFEEWAIPRIMRGERVRDLVLRVRGPETGHEFWASYNGSTIYDDRGRPRLMFLTMRDITDRKRAEEALQKARNSLELRVKERTAELNQAYEALQRETEEHKKLEEHLRQSQKMEALGTLAGGIAHDFNNLLGAVIGFTELLQDDLPEGDPGHVHAARVMEAGLRGRDLVKQMLMFSRKAEQEKQPLRLSSIVKESAKLLRASIPTTIAINVDVTSESGIILADPVQIQQVVMNLCTNAYYAMREWGGTLTIELSDFSVEPSNGNTQKIEPGLYMKLAVSDTGTGIPAKIMDRIFDPFFTTKMVGEGTGLGLSVVMGIVKQSGGYITVESEPGKGSTFSVYLPKVTGGLTADTKGKEEALPTGNEHILFVDDEEPLLEIGEQILTKLGYKVTTQMSSEVALALIEENPSRFDLVITDQTMPEMTGVELAKKILTIRPDMPVILCTGFSHLVDADSAKAAGIRGFTMKPLTKRETAKTVRKVLDGRNSA